MVTETIEGTYRQTNLTNESAEYLRKREEVRLTEIELMRARERVADLRRAPPKGAEVQDYEFFFDCTLDGRVSARRSRHDGRATADPSSHFNPQRNLWQAQRAFWYPLRVPSHPHFAEVIIRQVRKVNFHVVSPLQKHTPPAWL
jgi:Bacterial protein of unknown function (DUF899)